MTHVLRFLFCLFLGLTALQANPVSEMYFQGMKAYGDQDYKKASRFSKRF
jgi:hypothetical protein